MADLPIGIEATICVDEELRTPVVVPMGGEMGPGEDVRIVHARTMQIALYGLLNPECIPDVLAALSKTVELEEVVDQESGTFVEVLPPAGVEL